MSSPSPLQCTVATAPKWRSVRTKPHWQSRSGSAKCGVLHGPGVPLKALTTAPPAPRTPAASRAAPSHRQSALQSAPHAPQTAPRRPARAAGQSPPASKPASLPGRSRPRQGGPGLRGCSCGLPNDLERRFQIRPARVAGPRHRTTDQTHRRVHRAEPIHSRTVLTKEVEELVVPLRVGLDPLGHQFGAAARSGLVEVLAKLLVGSLRRLVIRASVVVVRSRRLELAVRCVGVAVAVAHADTSAHTASAHWRVRAEAASLWRLSERNAPSL